MKYLIMTIVCLSLIACGKYNPGGDTVQTPQTCTTELRYDGVHIYCPDGTSSFMPKPREPIAGPVGATGDQGIKGEKGDSCTVETVTGGSIIKCEDGSTSLILDGKDGVDGKNAVAELIDPCKDKLNAFDEILIRLSDGRIIAYFESGSTRFLSEIIPGSYVTTDSQRCYFTVEQDLTVTDQLGNVWKAESKI